MFGAAGDGIAKAAIPGLEHLAEVGEGYLETLVRVATNLSSVNQMFDVLGVNLYESSIAGAEASLAMSELFGGLDKLTETLSSYYKNFYTEEERMGKLTQDLTAKFKGMNEELPKTRQEFRDLATDLLNGGPEAQALAAEVLLLADAFNTTAEYADKLAKEQEEKVKKAKEDADKALNDAYSSLEKAVKAEQDILKERERIAQDSITRLKSIFDVLKQNISELYNEVQETKSLSSADGRKLITSAAKTGVLPDSKELSEAITAVRKEISSTSYATLFEEEKAKILLANELILIKDNAEIQMDTAELQLKSLRDQTRILDDLLVAMRRSVDIALGIDTVIKTVAGALADLNTALGPKKVPEGASKPSGPFAIGGSSGGSSGTYTSEKREANTANDIRKYVGDTFGDSTDYTDKTALGHISAMAGLEHWTNKQMSDALGIPVQDIKDLMVNAGYDWWAGDRYATGGAFTNNIVQRPTAFNSSLMGEAGPEAIMPLTNINGKLGVATSGSGNSELEAKVQNLSIELRAIASNTSKVARLLERVTRDGEALVVIDNALV